MRGLTKKEKEHLKRCKYKHYQSNATWMRKPLLVCKGTDQFVDLEALGKQIGKLMA